VSESQARHRVPALTFIFLVFFEEIFCVFGGILLPFDDAYQVGSKPLFAEHVKDVEHLRGIEKLTGHGGFMAKKPDPLVIQVEP
jgi:hypothetical protein